MACLASNTPEASTPSAQHPLSLSAPPRGLSEPTGHAPSRQQRTSELTERSNSFILKMERWRPLEGQKGLPGAARGGVG